MMHQKFSSTKMNPEIQHGTFHGIGQGAARAFWKSVVLLIVIGLSVSCDSAGDWLRNWGERSRRNRIEKLDETEVKKWERDLEISRDRVEELHNVIESIAQESNHQGELSRKLAKAYMKRGQFEMAIRHYSAALEKKLQKPGHPFGERISRFDNAIPYFNEALTRHTIDGELIFEAGLAYANASLDLGWEPGRWKAAEWLFQRARARMPQDSRALYQLALLYGKTTVDRLRDEQRAIGLLEELLTRAPNDISARFALAHILTQTGDLERATGEYRIIMDRLEDLHRSGVLAGAAKKNPKYKTAQENLQALEDCMAGRPGCQILDIQ